MPPKKTKPSAPLKRRRTRANPGNGSDTDIPPPKKQKATHQKQPDSAAVTPSLVPPPIPHPLAPTASLGPNAEELQWFERIKKHISNKTALTEFHKLLNLYTQDIISAPYCKYRAKSFFGNQTELLVWLNNFLGDEDDEPDIENVVRPTHARISLANCRGLGPSYRLLPKQESNQVCSGRDDLCRSVLNDEWASHPTWESEESGFVAHKKTAFEEALHRIEEERHDYDSNLEVLDRTIQLLEPIKKALDGMSLDAQKNYRLDKRLGGQSEMLWKRITYKLYGRENGAKVIQNLFVTPYVVVPVLLLRFTTVREIWKSAQRHWNTIWRQQMNQNYHRALDAQGVHKIKDNQKQFTQKSLVLDIKARSEDTKKNKTLRQDGKQPQQNVPNIKGYQFVHKMERLDILLDAARLFLLYIHQNLSTENPSLGKTMKDLICLFFSIDQSLLQLPTSDADSPGSESSAPTADQADSPRPRNTRKGKGKDLRKAALTKASGASASASVSRDGTPDPASTVEGDANGVAAEESDASASPSQEKWFKTPSAVVDDKVINPDEQFPRKDYHMYCNGPIYCLLHLFGMLYDRLVFVADYEDEVKAMVAMQKEQKPAHDLNMIDGTPDVFFRDTSSTANYYKQVLAIFEDSIKGATEQSLVEETLRRFYLPEGWRLYHIDKHLAAMARFGITLTGSEGKDKSTEIYHLFKKDRIKEKASLHEDMMYRKQFTKYLASGKDKDDNTPYRITYNIEAKWMMIQIFDKDSSTFDLSGFDAPKRWQHYVNSYSGMELTEDVSMNDVQWPMARRHTPTEGALEDAVTDRATRSEEGLWFNIKPVGLKPDFRPGNSEWIFKENHSDEPLIVERKADLAQERFVTNNSWMQGLSKDEVDKAKAEAQAILMGDEIAVAADTDGEIQVTEAEPAPIHANNGADGGEDSIMADPEG